MKKKKVPDYQEKAHNDWVNRMKKAGYVRQSYWVKPKWKIKELVSKLRKEENE